MSVINDILDFSKIEARKLDLENIVFHLRSTISATMKALEFRAAGKNIELIYHVAPHVPEVLVGDPGRLRQVLLNLVGNAIKFTERGEIVVQVDGEPAANGSVALRFSVRDTGIGIPRDKRKAIFEAFSQGDTSTSRQFGGTGLGLTISSQLIAMMGGLLGVESEPGHGSTFSFTIYLTLPSEPYEDPVRAPLADLLDLPVLAVDDNATNRRILGQTLSSHGLCPTLSASGVEAMESLKHAVFAGNPYPLVIADAYMPHMDGFELVEAIRREPLFGNPALVLLTSGGRRGDGARCRELGVSAYLTKPVGEAELLEAILRVLGKKADPAAAAELITRHTIRETQRQLRVLVVDDNAVNRHLAIRLIEKQGHLVIPVSSGRAALAELAQHAFDLILMDVQMPEMDGFETTRAIRDRERLTGARVPIIAMTAHAMQGDRQRCLAAEMDEYVAKPIAAPLLFAAMENALRHAKNGVLSF